MPASAHTQPVLGHREASTNGSLTIRLGVRQGCGWRGLCGGPCFLQELAGAASQAAMPWPSQAAPYLDKPRNVHRQTRSFLASLPLGGASCTHTQFGE